MLLNLNIVEWLTLIKYLWIYTLFWWRCAPDLLYESLRNAQNHLGGNAHEQVHFTAKLTKVLPPWNRSLCWNGHGGNYVRTQSVLLSGWIFKMHWIIVRVIQNLFWKASPFVVLQFYMHKCPQHFVPLCTSCALLNFIPKIEYLKLDWVNYFPRGALGGTRPERAEESCWPRPFTSEWSSIQVSFKI